MVDAEEYQRWRVEADHPDAHAAGDAASHFGRLDADAAQRDAQDVLEWVDAQWQELQ